MGRAEDPEVGLCESCRHARRVRSAKGSTFWRCAEPGLPRYPTLPVKRCAAHEGAGVPPPLGGGKDG